MAVSLKRIIPKLNTMYGNLDARISFAVAEFIFEYLLEKYGENKEDYYYIFLELLGIGESNYENFLNGKRVVSLNKRRDVEGQLYDAQKISEGTVKFQIAGISKREWRRYLDIKVKYQRLKADEGTFSKDVRKHAEVETKQIIDNSGYFKKKIFNKIEKQEMNLEAYRLYRQIAKQLFNEDIYMDSSEQIDEWLKTLEKISEGNLQNLYEQNRSEYRKIYLLLKDKYKMCCEIANMNKAKKS